MLIICEIYLPLADQSHRPIFPLIPRLSSSLFSKQVSPNPSTALIPPHQPTMSVEISLITPQDIPHAITTIQSAFTDDPFNYFIYDQTSLSLARNAASLGIRLRWGIANGHVLVAHTPERRCAGVAMWVPPKPLREAQTWREWGQSWWLWIQQVKTNLRYGRGGLRVDVCPSHDIYLLDRDIGCGRNDRRRCRRRCGWMRRDIGF
jgi:hypothetical protein